MKPTDSGEYFRGLVVDQKALCKACQKNGYGLQASMFCKGAGTFGRAPLTLPNVTVMPIWEVPRTIPGGMSRLAAQNLIDALKDGNRFMW